MEHRRERGGSDGLITKVELIDGNEVLDALQPNSQTVSILKYRPFHYLFDSGTHSLILRLTDDHGATADHAIDVVIRPAPTSSDFNSRG